MCFGWDCKVNDFRPNSRPSVRDFDTWATGTAKNTGTKLLRELRIGPCSEDRNGGLDESGDDNLLHAKRVYQ